MKNGRLPIYAAAAWCAVIGPAFAGSHEACPLTYEVFEYAVPHTDMEECPSVMVREGAFCRVAIVAETATIFTFSEETGCILESKSFDEDQFAIEFK